MEVEPLDLPGTCLIRPRRFSDPRGTFSETFNKERYQAAGIDADFIQDNLSHSTSAGTVRGLHFQAPPSAQAKLVQCIHGAIFDVAVDIRAGSPTYGQWTGAELSAENGTQMFVPEGFAHGFMTLRPDTLVLYKVNAPYSPASEGGLAWDDAALAIGWPVPMAPVTLSDRDTAWPAFECFKTPFTAQQP